MSYTNKILVSLISHNNSCIFHLISPEDATALPGIERATSSYISTFTATATAPEKLITEQVLNMQK